MFIDVHAHMADEKLYYHTEDILFRSGDVGVDKIICASYDLNSCQDALGLSSVYAPIYVALGIHPNNAEQFNEDFVEFVKQNALNEKVVAIGEIGLDYHFPPFDKELQKKVFVAQLKLANELGLPIQIHCRDAIDDMIKILEENKELLSNGGIMHCFSEDVESLNKILALGLSVSYGGVVTFKNAKMLVETVKQTPLENITLETDCPYLTPHPHRGKINDPSYCVLTAEKIAQIKNINLEELEEITTQNALRIFPKLKNEN